MFSIYIACLIIGGVLLLFSVIFGGDHSDVDADHSIDVDHDVDMDTDTHLGAGESLEMDSDHDFQSHVEEVASADAVKFISFRNIIFFMAFFGLTGTSMSILSITSLVTLFSAIGVGMFSAVLGFRFLKYLKENESGEAFDIYKLKGMNGTVTIPVSKERKGKISVNLGINTIDILAQASDIAKKEKFAPGDEVLIIDVRNDHVYVVDSKI
jgi:membrane protein implicated in regulation of membrane protease activity